MRRGLENIKHEERSYFDFVVKERLARLIASKSEGVTCDFGERYDSKNASLYHIPFEDFNLETNDFRFYVRDLIDEDVLEFETDWNFPVSLSCFVALGYSGTVSASGVRKRPDAEILSSVYMYTDSFSEGQEPFLISFVRSYEKYLEGDKEGAFSDPVFKDVCENLAYIFSPMDEKLPAEFAADNAGLLLSSFLTGDEDENRVIVYTSKEIALYDKYKESLPLDVRGMADDYVAVCRQPVSLSGDSHCRHKIYGDTAATLVVEVLGDDLNGEVESGYEDIAMESIVCPREFNVYFESAVRWLDKNLKELRGEYCKESA